MSKHTSDQTGQHITPGPGSGVNFSQRSAERSNVDPHAEHEGIDHFALVYEDQTEQFATAIPFIQEGIERGERCVYVADDNTVNEVLDAMRARGVDVDAALDSGMLSVHTEADTYRRTGEFDRDAMLDFWNETLAEGTDDGFTGLRAAAEMTWALDADDTGLHQLCEYEKLLNPLFDGEDYAVLCQYNRDRFPADVLHEVLETHPYLIIDATVCENFYYTPPEEYFGSDQPSREFDRKLATLVNHTEARSALQTQTRFQQQLYEIVSQSGSFDEKLQAVFDLGCDVFGLDLGGVAKVDPDTGLFEVEAVSDEHAHLVPGARVDLEETYCRVVATEGAGDAVPDPVAITDPEASGFSEAACVAEFGVQTYLGTRIPVTGNCDRTFFFVAEEPRDRAFTETERTFHRLMGQWIQYELERHQREHFLRNCYQITADSARSFEEKLEALIDLGCEQFGFEYGGLARIDTDSDLFEVEEINGEHDHLVPGEQYPLSETYCSLATEDGETAAVSDPVSAGFEGKLCYEQFGVEAYLGTHLPIDGDLDRTFWFVSNEPLDTPITEMEQTFIHLMGQWVQYELKRRQRERELRERTQHLNALVETTPECIKTVAPDGTLLQMNSAGLDMGEADTESDVVGECVYDLIPPEHREKYREFNERICRGESGTLEFDIIGLEGTRRHMESHAAPLERPDGTTVQLALTRDITEQKERQAELRQTKNRFETVFEQSGDGIFIIDPDVDELVDANPAAAEMTGYTRDELMSLRPSDLHPDEMEQFRAVLAEAREQGSAWSEDLHCRHNDGHDIPSEVTASAITLDGRDLVLALVRRIDERKKHERYQRNLHEITAAPDLEFDEKVVQMLELGRDRFGLEIGGLNHLPSWDGEFQMEKAVGFDSDRYEELRTAPGKECFCHQTITAEETIGMLDLNETEWPECTIHREFDVTSYLGTKVTSGATTYGTLWFGSTEPRDRPFSDAERSFIELMGQWLGYEIERREHNDSQRELYEITADPDLDTDEKIDRLLEVGCDHLDLSVGMLTRDRGEAFEIEYMHGTHPDLDEGTLTPPLTDNYCRQVVETGESVGVPDAGAAGWDEDALYQEFNLQCYAGMQVTGGGDVYGTVCFTDTSPREEFTNTEQAFLDLLGQCVSYELERQQYERELEETIDRLQRSNERLEQFAYAASHDLQEPLRMVTSYLQLLENRYSDAFDEDGEEYLEFAVDGANRMREMIDGLLAYSRVETRGDPFEAVELDAVLDDALTDLQIEIEETNAEISAEQLPCVEGDASQLRQVFQNLLDNALTYSGDEPPHIHIDAERRGREWVISVHDDGIGIDADDQNRIFTVFDRLHSRTEYDGTGLGLALCQRIVERHNGEIWVESEPGGGSTFLFTLPAAIDGQ